MYLFFGKDAKCEIMPLQRRLLLKQAVNQQRHKEARPTELFEILEATIKVLPDK